MAVWGWGPGKPLHTSVPMSAAKGYARTDTLPSSPSCTLPSLHHVASAQVPAFDLEEMALWIAHLARCDVVPDITDDPEQLVRIEGHTLLHHL